jgi:single-strand DNA-binding protein
MVQSPWHQNGDPRPDASYCTLVGHLTRDPELHYGRSGVPRITVGLAVNPRHRDEGDLEDVPSAFVDLVAFSDLAENVAASLTRGDRVVATGRLEEAAETATNGSDHSSGRLIAKEVGVSLRFTEVRVYRAGRRPVDRALAESSAPPRFQHSAPA